MDQFLVCLTVFFAELEKFKVDADMTSKALQQEIQLREESERHVASLNRDPFTGLEGDNESYQDKLDWAHNKLDNTVQSAEEANKLVKSLETKLELDDGELVKLEEQVATAKQIAEETGRKYEEAARKLALVEADLERAEERAEAGESKNVELEQEVKVVSLNLKSLEASEIQSCKSEDSFSEQLRTLNEQWKAYEVRSEAAERAVQRLQREVDTLEDSVMAAKNKNKKLGEEMEAAFRDIQNL